MHYFQKNIADYRKDTAHLSLLEHGIYNQLIDTYYLDEKPIKTQPVIRRLTIITDEEKIALDNVLNDFFQRSECGEFWIHERIEEEIKKYKAKAETAKVNGSKGGRPKKPKKTQPVNSGNPEKTGSKANHKPLTNNHKPGRVVFLPPNENQVHELFLSVDMTDDGGAEARRFIDYYGQQNWKLSNGNKMADWKAAARNWLRNQQKWESQK